MGKLSDELQREQNIKTAKTWNDLDEDLKETALKCKVAYQGKIQTLSSLQGSMTDEEFDIFLNTQIHQRNIRKLFKTGVVSLGRPKKPDVQSSQNETPVSTLFSDSSVYTMPKSMLSAAKNPVLKVVTNEDSASMSNLKAGPFTPTHSFNFTEPNTVANRHLSTIASLSSAPVQIRENEIPTHSSDPPFDTRLPTATLKYFKSETLGVGSGGTNVYKGQFGQRDVAVKVISNFKDTSEAENETRVLLQCDKHENIVRYIYSEMSSDGFLIALELCEKFTLADWVDDPNCIKIDIEPLDVLRQATQGLGFLHQPKINIVHRDLKPSNILFLIRGNEVVVKISDFGISRSISLGRNTRTVTRFGGTSGWTAAEMLEVESIMSKTRRSEKNTEKIPKMTKKIDIFSLGCIYYFVLTKGEHPFGDNERLRDHKIETDDNILDDIDLKLYDLRLQCNLSLLQIMIAKDPNLRPDVDYILAHPIFWSHKKMIDFIDEISNFINKPTPENEQICLACVDKLERNYFPKISNGSSEGWFVCLDNVLKPFFIQRYKNHKDKAIKLVRTLRNYKHHYHENDFEIDIKKHIGGMPNEFMIYWLTFFPTLINELRDAFVDLQREDNFKEYFRT